MKKNLNEISQALENAKVKAEAKAQESIKKAEAKAEAEKAEAEKAEAKAKAEKAEAEKCAKVIGRAKADAKKAEDKADAAIGNAVVKGARAYAEALKTMDEKTLGKYLNSILDTKNDGAMRTWLCRVRKAYSLLSLMPENGASLRMIDAMTEAKKAGMDDSKIREYAENGQIELLKAVKTAEAKPEAEAEAKAESRPARVKPAQTEDKAVRATALYEKIKTVLTDAEALQALEALAIMAGMPSITA